LPQFDTELETIYEIDEPKQYAVILHNDDYTSMDFVMQVLMSIFRKNELEAGEIMMQVHKQGKAICGIFTLEIAKTKVAQVTKLAKQNDLPLRTTYEEA
jgi:ATP-dependent Clp protease adaptor protein ClpS